MTDTTIVQNRSVWNAFAALALAHGREFFRNRTTAFGSILLPLVFTGLLVGVGKALGEDSMLGLYFALAMYFSVASVCFFGAVAPMIALKERGVNRLLATAPQPGWIVLTSLIPVRLLVFALLIAVQLGIGTALGLTTMANAGPQIMACLCVAAFMLSLGLAVSVLLPNVEAANNALSLVMLVVMFLGGAMVPFSTLPDWLFEVLSALPPARMFDLLFVAFLGTPFEYTLLSDLVVLLGGSAVIVGIGLAVSRHVERVQLKAS